MNLLAHTLANELGHHLRVRNMIYGKWAGTEINVNEGFLRGGEPLWKPMAWVHGATEDETQENDNRRVELHSQTPSFEMINGGIA